MSDQPMRASERDEVKSPDSVAYAKIKPILQVFSDYAESGHPSSDFLELLLNQIKTILGADLLLLFGRDEKHEDWIVVSHHGMPKGFGKEVPILRAWQSLPSIVLQEGRGLFSGEISKDRKFVGQVIRGFDVQSFAGTTLRSGDKVFGSLSIAYSRPNALSPEDKETFLLISNLVCPFLLERIHGKKEEQQHVQTPVRVEEQGEEKEEEPLFNVSLDRYGRILESNPPFSDYLGYGVEKISNLPLSRFLTPNGVASYSNQVKSLKSGKKTKVSFDLEVVKKGGLKGVLSVDLTSTQQGKNPLQLRLSGRDATDIQTLEKELVRRNIEHGIVESTLSILSHYVKEEEILQRALEEVLASVDMDGGYLLKLEEKSNRLFLSARHHIAEETAERFEKHGVKVGDGGIGKVIVRKSPTLIVAEEAKAPLKKRLVGEEGLLSYMGIPIKLSGSPWGILCLFSRSRIFTKDDVEILKRVAKALAYALESTKMFAGMRKQVEDLRVINEVGQSIAKSLHLEQLLPSIANSLKQMVGASNCYIFSVEDKRSLLLGVAGSDHCSEAIRKVEYKMNENMIAPMTARDRHPIVVENAPHDARVGKKWIKTFKSRSLFSIPLIKKERIVGVVLLDETRYFRSFSKGDIERIERMASQIAYAFENAVAHQAVQKHLERLQSLSSAMANIQEEERRRIARKLRDESGKNMKNIKNTLECMKKELGNPEEALRARLNQILDQAGKTLEGVQKLSHDLRPAILDESGLIATLQWYADTFTKQTGTKVHLQLSGSKKRFSARLETLLYRIVLAAMNNVSRHANAESVVISLEKKDIHLHLYMTDDGRGFDVKRYFASPPMSRRGIGILGMKERVELSGGTFFIDSTPGHGTRISIKLPLVKRGS
ncbi:MAG: GAF domain-containing sensor histidine kinase [Nitrospiria bacterium]